MKGLNLIIFSLLLLSIFCADCYQGQYWDNKLNQCQQCHISCNSCTSDQRCSTCYDQMFLVTRGNKIQCDLCYNVQDNCQVCISAQKCQKCTNGYFLNQNNQCLTCHHYQPYCIYCFQNSTFMECITCNTTHRLVHGRCLPKDPNFKQPAQNNNQNPTQAQNNKPKTDNTKTTPEESQAAPKEPQNTEQNNNLPEENDQKNNIQKTVNQQQTPKTKEKKVVKCQSNQIKLRDICVLVIPFCEQYDEKTLKCKDCQLTFVLNQGFCIPQILLANQGNQIDQTPANSGSQGITPTFQAQQQPQDCSDDQYYWWGRCVTIGTQCVKQDDDKKCIQCILGYQVNSEGLCSQLSQAKAMRQAALKANKQNSPANSQSNNQNPVRQDLSAVSEAFPDNPTVEDSTFSSSSINCNKNNKCQTCDEQHPDFCKSCLEGYTTVDAFPGRCFPLNP